MPGDRDRYTRIREIWEKFYPATISKPLGAVIHRSVILAGSQGSYSTIHIRGGGTDNRVVLGWLVAIDKSDEVRYYDARWHDFLEIEAIIS